MAAIQGTHHVQPVSAGKGADSVGATCCNRECDKQSTIAHKNAPSPTKHTRMRVRKHTLRRNTVPPCISRAQPTMHLHKCNRCIKLEVRTSKPTTHQRFLHMTGLSPLITASYPLLTIGEPKTAIDQPPIAVR